MKKLFLLAFAALSVSAAQAASLAWSIDSTSTTSSQTLDSSNYITDTSSALFLTTVTLTADANSYFLARLDSYGSNLIEFSYQQGTGLVVSVFAGATEYTATYAANLSTGDTFTAGLLFTRNNGTDSMSIYYEGAIVGTIENIVLEEGEPFLYVAVGSRTGAATVSNSSLYVDPTSDDIIAEYTAMAVAYTVPEPTILALLALGVAGLALKRRV